MTRILRTQLKKVDGQWEEGEIDAIVCLGFQTLMATTKPDTIVVIQECYVWSIPFWTGKSVDKLTLSGAVGHDDFQMEHL